MDPRNDELYYRAVREMEKGAAESALELTQLEPNSERSVILQSQLLESKGQLVQAMEMLEDFAGKNFSCGYARGNLARLQWLNGFPEKALATLRIALAQKPNQERTLHFYASLLEERHGFESAFRSLLGLGTPQGAWMPAWVAAVLAGSQNRPELCGQALVACAEKSEGRFPPHLETLLKLLAKLEPTAGRECWNALRPFCHTEARAKGDEAFSRTVDRSTGEPGSAVKGRLLGGTAGHALLSDKPARCFITPIRLIKPETWEAEEIAGALGRGLAILLAETLAFQYDVLTETGFLVSPEQGIHFYQDLPPQQDLVKLAGPGCDLILSAYLSRKADGEFTLDCEQYDAGGNYLGHLTEKAAEPGECVTRLAARLAEGLATSQLGLPDWQPGWDLDSLMARDTAGAFLLCGDGVLSAKRLPNPGLSLDLLAEHSAESQNPLDLVSYWNAMCAAERMGVRSAREQKALLAGLLQKDESFRPFLDAQSKKP